MARVFTTKDARTDLKDIGRWIAEQSGSRSIALRFLEKIDEKCQAYARQPEMGDPRPDLAETVRCFPVGNFVVFYRPRQEGIEVLLVMRGSRDILVLFRRRIRDHKE